MSHASNANLSTGVTRLIRDKVATWLVTSGALLVLAALLLIFIYLFFVVEPVFESVDIQKENSFVLTNSKTVLASGLDDKAKYSYQFMADGTVQFMQIHQGLNRIRDLSKPVSALSHQRLQVLPATANDEDIVFARSEAAVDLYAYGSGSSISVFTPTIHADLADSHQVIPVELNFPFGEKPVEILPHELALKTFHFSRFNGQLGVLSSTKSNEVYLAIINEDEQIESSNQLPVLSKLFLPEQESELAEPYRVDDVYLSADLFRAYVRTGRLVHIYNIQRPKAVQLIQTVEVALEDQSISAFAFLSGGHSMLVAKSNGHIDQWFEVIQQGSRQYVNVRTFTTDLNHISAIMPEHYRKGFLVVDQDGQAELYYATSKFKLWEGEISASGIQSLAFSSRADYLAVVSNNVLNVYSVDNEHPEVTWDGLWEQVWYEGYSEPDYVWQSSSASDVVEPKFSLVPISFGTFKAAFYAMLFSIPLGLAAAIYTAYFMSPGLRKIVKPTVEIMEALPTVILGFLAGLWLAPLFEQNLTAVVLLFVLLPLSVVLFALLWFSLPGRFKAWLPEGTEPVVMIPIIIVVVWSCFAADNWLEFMIFGGDVRDFITNDLGIDYDQRNSLVVGVAMGFAVIPTIFSITEDAVFSVPRHLSNGSLALGATPWQTLVRVVLLTASPGIFSAVMMGLGRAVGETMIVLMATGSTPVMDWSILEGMRTMAANIAVEMPESEVNSTHYRVLFLAAFVLLLFTFIFNTAAEFVRQRLREKYRSL